MGSQAYGTATLNSDIDIKGIYIQSIYDVASLYNYKQQLMPDKDTTYYEVKRFLELACSANPTILELMWMPDRCIQVKDPLFIKYIESNRDLFLTKQCCNSFMGYAYQQIHKAQGLNKTMNWEQDRITRRKPIDFCKFIWIHNGNVTNKLGLYPVQNFYQTLCLTKIDNTKQLYKLWNIVYNPSKIKSELCNDDNLLVTAIPENAEADLLAIVQYDLDGFQAHCREYNQYQTWLKKRNEQRYVDVQNHGQKIDGKNMLHCMRLIQMAREIATEHKIIVERPNRQELLDIRHGKYDLNSLLSKAKDEIKEIEELFKNSDLPDKPDFDKINEISINIRKEYEQD